MTVSFTTATDTSRQDRTANGLVSVLALSTFIAMVHGMVLAPLIPAISTDPGTSAVLIGQVPAVSMVRADLAMVGTGALALSFAAACIVWSTRPPPDAVGLQQEQCVSNPTLIPQTGHAI